MSEAATGGVGTPSPSNGASSSGNTVGSESTSTSNGTAQQTTHRTAEPGAAPEMQSTAPVEPWRTMKHKVNVRGVEAEVPYDELVKGFQRARDSQAQYEEAHRLKKQAEGLIRGLQQAAQQGDHAKFRAFAKKLGYDVRGMAEAELSEALRQEQMSPEERRRAELDRRDRELRMREQRIAKEQHDRQVKFLEERYVEEAQTRVPAALKAAGVPQTPWHLRRLATLMSESIGTEHELSYEDAATLVAEEYREERTADLGALSVDDLLALIGEERMKEVRRRDIERVRGGGAPPSPSELAPASRGQPKPKPPPMTTEAFFKKLRRSL